MKIDIPNVVVYIAIFALLSVANRFYYLGKNHFILTFLGIAGIWYGLAKFCGLKGRESFWLLDYFGGAITKIVGFIILIPISAGFVSNFVKTTKMSVGKFGSVNINYTWTYIITTLLFFISIVAIIGYFGKGHKPQKLIDEELEEKLSNLSIDELKEIKDNLEQENDKLRAKKEEKLREIVDEFVEECKEETMSEIEKLKIENEALKKQLQGKENGEQR